MKTELDNERKDAEDPSPSAPHSFQDNTDTHLNPESSDNLNDSFDLILEAEQFLAAVANGATKPAADVNDVLTEDADSSPQVQEQSGESSKSTIMDSPPMKSDESPREYSGIDTSIADEQTVLARKKKRDQAMEALDMILGPSSASPTGTKAEDIGAAEHESKGNEECSSAGSYPKKPSTASEGLSMLAARRNWKDASDIESILEMCFSESLSQKRRSSDDNMVAEFDSAHEQETATAIATDPLKSPSSQFANQLQDVESGKTVPYQGWPKKSAEEQLIEDYESYTEEMEEFHPLPKLVVKKDANFCSRRRQCCILVCLLLLAAVGAAGVTVAIRCGSQGCLDATEEQETSSTTVTASVINTEMPSTSPTFQFIEPTASPTFQFIEPTTSPTFQEPTTSPASQAPTTAPVSQTAAAVSTTQALTTNSPTFNVMDGLPYYTLEAMKDTSSPQSLAYAWIQHDPLLHNYSNERLLQRFALATLFYATRGTRWSESSGWLSYDHDECTWFSKTQPAGYPEHNGYPCDQDLQYRFLTLPDNGLAGTIPEEVFLLSSLHILDLSTNTLQGSVPTEVGTLGPLQQLLLAQSGLTGSVPTEIGALTNMKQLVLNTNQFSGSLSTTLGSLSNLTKLIIFETSITGEIPTELGMLPLLTKLDLDTNKLSSTIPTELGMLDSIEALSLYRNALSGPIPTELGLLNNMMSLNLEGNRLTSTIPEVLGSLESLEQLFLRGNELEGNIEGLFFESSSLIVLSVEENNMLTGTLPNAFCQLDALGFTCSDRLCGCWCECQTSG